VLFEGTGTEAPGRQVARTSGLVHACLAWLAKCTGGQGPLAGFGRAGHDADAVVAAARGEGRGDEVRKEKEGMR
jgi:hypothetical protein